MEKIKSTLQSLNTLVFPSLDEKDSSSFKLLMETLMKDLAELEKSQEEQKRQTNEILMILRTHARNMLADAEKIEASYSEGGRSTKRKK